MYFKIEKREKKRILLELYHVRGGHSCITIVKVAKRHVEPLLKYDV
jgi:hypothetical protein